MFTLLSQDGLARRGRCRTPHGTVETPVFMNVGTQAAIKGGLSAFDLHDVGCQVALSNAYHLHLRPGEGIVREQGGLHQFMRWDAPILTDSGGFQVFSLARLRKITEDGVTFASHIDGRRIHLRPEDSVDIQSALGADIAMAFDECVDAGASYAYVKDSAARTARWLGRCAARLWEIGAEGVNPGQALWGINQGGVYDGLRVGHMKAIRELDLPGYAIGGLSVGETPEVMYHILDTLEEHMPADRPRYLMGVGTPGNIIESVARGIDFFDCVLPARNARHGRLYTWQGWRNVKNERYKSDSRPPEEGCGCPCCRSFSRAYLRHLFKAEEMLAARLSVLHNLWFYNSLAQRIRQAVEAGRFSEFRRQYAEQLDAPEDR